MAPSEGFHEQQGSGRSVRTFRAGVFLTLTLATLAVYARTFGYGYVVFDDYQYVVQNPMVKHGISATGLKWAFTAFWSSNWHPLTWISLMLDCQVAGINPGEQHAVNVFLHLASGLLLFVTTWRMTGQRWRCAFLAGIFTIHPVHVESVAWIAERKDVLSTFFEILTLAFYVSYTERPDRKRYAAVAVAFLMALLSKPMAVTFPFVLLLMDYWPLKRMPWPPKWPVARSLLTEKWLLLALAAPSCVLTYLAQRQGHAVVPVDKFPVWMRLGNAAVAYVAYLGKTFWPTHLSILYPLEKPDGRVVLGALLILTAITAGVLREIQRRPYLAVGWFWFVGMLVPVIGIVQVGVQSMADRYMYVPMVGISLSLIWWCGDLLHGHIQGQRAAAVLATAWLAACGFLAYRQVGYWSSTKVLFTHALSLARGNHFIENNLGVALAHEGDYAGAVRLFRLALGQSPNWPDALTNQGAVLVAMGRPRDAVAPLERAIRLDRGRSESHAALGAAFAALDRFAESRRELETALEANPTDVLSHSNLCYSLIRIKLLDEAVRHCQTALALEPGYRNAHINLADALTAEGRTAEAAAQLALVPASSAKKTGASREIPSLSEDK